MELPQHTPSVQFILSGNGVLGSVVVVVEVIEFTGNEMLAKEESVVSLSDDDDDDDEDEDDDDEDDEDDEDDNDEIPTPLIV